MVAGVIWATLWWGLHRTVGGAPTGFAVRRALFAVIWVHGLGGGADDAAVELFMSWGPDARACLRAMDAAGLFGPEHTFAVKLLLM